MVFRLNAHFSVCLTCKMLHLGKMVFFKFQMDKVEVSHLFAWRKHRSYGWFITAAFFFRFTINCCVSSSFNQFPGLSLGCSGYEKLSCCLSGKLSSSFCTSDLSWAASSPQLFSDRLFFCYSCPTIKQSAKHLNKHFLLRGLTQDSQIHTAGFHREHELCCSVLFRAGNRDLPCQGMRNPEQGVFWM